MDKRTMNQIVKAKGGKLEYSNNTLSCYLMPYSEEKETWFYKWRWNTGFNVMLFRCDSESGIKFNVYWDMPINKEDY